MTLDKIFKPASKRVMDLSNRKFGHWTAVRPLGSYNTTFYWLCRCDCGEEVAVDPRQLRKGGSRSCGCQPRKSGSDHYNYKHGMTETKTYAAWMAMIARCKYKSTGCFHRYGGRGIKVCQRWSEFVNFLQDMGEVPDGLTLDRINNDGNYEPENCRWATRKEQGANYSKNRRLTVNGETLHITEWARRLGTSHGTIKYRLSQGWSPERAVSTPPRFNHPDEPEKKPQTEELTP